VIVKTASDFLLSNERVTLAVKYEPLSLATRKQVWVSFLKKAVTVNGAAKSIKKSSTDWRGRISTVDRLDSHQKHGSCGLCVSRVSEHKGVHASLGPVTGLNEEFESDFGKDSNKYSYL